MSFSIVCTRPGAFRIVLRGGFTPSSSSLLRRELAAVLIARPTEVEVRVADHTLVKGAASALLESFFDILWSRSCRVTFAHADDRPVVVADRPELRRLLAGQGSSSATA